MVGVGLGVRFPKWQLINKATVSAGLGTKSLQADCRTQKSRGT